MSIFHLSILRTVAQVDDTPSRRLRTIEEKRKRPCKQIIVLDVGTKYIVMLLSNGVLLAPSSSLSSIRFQFRFSYLHISSLMTSTYTLSLHIRSIYRSILRQFNAYTTKLSQIFTKRFGKFSFFFFFGVAPYFYDKSVTMNIAYVAMGGLCQSFQTFRTAKMQSNVQ